MKSKVLDADVDRLGKRKFIKKYNQAGTMDLKSKVKTGQGLDIFMMIINGKIGLERCIRKMLIK